MLTTLTDFTTVMSFGHPAITKKDLKLIKLPRNPIQVWLLVNGNQLFIKNNNIWDDNSVLLSPSNVTVESSSIQSALNKIEKEWGIIMCADNLQKAYNFRDFSKKHGINTDVYILSLDMDETQKEAIKEISSGDFLDLNDLSKVAESNSPRVTASFDALIHYLSNNS